MWSWPHRKFNAWPAVVACLCVLAALPSFAQTDESDGNSGGGYTVGGVVVNAVTGDPVRRAMVQITNLSGGPVSSITDAEGRFQFMHVPSAEVVLVARKPGYFSDQELHPERPMPETFFRVEGNTNSTVIKLFPEGLISGRVTTVQSEPIEDVPVRVYQQRIMDGRKRWMQRSQSTSDEDGQFRLANLPAGQYLVSAGPLSAVGHRRVRGRQASRQEQINTTFYPGVLDVDGATPITVASGQQAQADFLLKPEPVFKVSGVVTGLAVGASTAPMLTTRSGEAFPVPINFDPQTGKFDVEVPAGSYVLTLRMADEAGNPMGADLPLTVNSDVQNVTLAVGSRMVIPIRVETRSTSASSEPGLRPRMVTFMSGNTTRTLRMPPVRVQLISSESRMENAEFQADLGGDGSYALRNFAPGRYSVDVQPNNPWYVQSATSGTTDLLHEDLVISPGRRPEPIEIVLRDDGATVSGTIRAEGQPVPGSVLLVPEQSSPVQIRVTAAAPGGDFLFDRVPPGDYKVLALDTVADLEFRNPEVLGQYLSKAERITLTAGQQANVSLERVAAGR
jgi:carboxypeptidase family protein